MVAALVVPIVLHQPKPWSDANIEEKCGFIIDDGLQKTCRDYYAQINHNIRMKTDKEYRQSQERWYPIASCVKPVARAHRARHLSG